MVYGTQMGMSENGVYPQWNSHWVGIMIKFTIGCRGTLFSDKPISQNQHQHIQNGMTLKCFYDLKKPHNQTKTTRFVFMII